MMLDVLTVLTLARALRCLVIQAYHEEMGVIDIFAGLVNFF